MQFLLTADTTLRLYNTIEAYVLCSYFFMLFHGSKKPGGKIVAHWRLSTFLARLALGRVLALGVLFLCGSAALLPFLLARLLFQETEINSPDIYMYSTHESRIFVVRLR